MNYKKLDRKLFKIVTNILVVSGITIITIILLCAFYKTLTINSSFGKLDWFIASISLIVLIAATIGSFITAFDFKSGTFLILALVGSGLVMYITYQFFKFYPY